MADLDAPGDHIFVFDGTGAAYQADFQLEDNQSLVGEGAVGTNLGDVLGIDVPEFTPMSALTFVNGTAPVFTNSGSLPVISLASSNLIDGIAIEANGTQAGLHGDSVTGGIVRDVGIDIANLSSDTAGIDITTANGEINFSNVEITTSGGTTAGTGIKIGGGDATIQFDNVDITQTGGRLVSISLGGEVTFDAEGDLTLTSGSVSGGGIKLSGSATSTFNFEGDIQLSGAGSAGSFVATGGGIVNVTGSNNTIVSTSPTAAGLTISGGTIIGNSGVTFKSIQSSGSTATVLTDTGAINGLTITGGSFTSDTYVGSDGPDVLRGGPGADTLTGGPGADRFDLAAGEGNPLLVQEETITDFKDGVDRIGLLGGLTFADLTIGSFSGHATIQVTATGEFLATVLDEAGNIDASDFVQPLLIGDTDAASPPPSGANHSTDSPQNSPISGNQTISLLTDNDVLRQSELDLIVEAATTRWISTGLSDDQNRALNGTTFDVAEMSDWYLGAFDGTGVKIDSDAAGYGWYVDATPFNDGDDVIGARVDLLTTVMHEMGHVLGLSDIYDSTKSDSLMCGFLSTGERRTPDTGQAEDATPGSVSSEAFMISPIGIGTLPVGKAVQITFSATVNNGLSASVTQVSNQGTVSGQNFVNVPTDDPTVGGAANPTITAIDNASPTVTVNIVDASLSDNDAVSAVTFEFNEDVVGFTSADVWVSGGSLSNFGSVDGNSYTATFTANGGVDVIGSVSVGTGYSDSVGNTGTTGSDNVAIDTLNPTIVVNIIDASLSDNDAESSVTFEFSENVVGFAAADVSVSGGTHSNFGTVDGNSYTATFTANGGVDLTGSVSVGAASYTDIVGNGGSSGSNSVTIDTLNPTVTVNIVDAALSDSDAESLVTFEFSEDISGFGVEDVAMSGGTLNDFSVVDGNSFSAMFTAADGIGILGSVSVGTGYTDAAGNTGTAGSDTVTIDTTRPTVAITPDGTTTSDLPIVFTFQFSEAVTGFVAGDVGITNGSAGTFTPVDGDTFTLKVTPTSPGTVTVSVAAGVAQDAAGNDNISASALVTSSASGEVALPGGGIYQVLINGGDLVVRIAGGAEQFRRSVDFVSVLEIMGSAGADLITILNSGGTVATPILFTGKGGDDQFDASLATSSTTLIGGGDDTLTLTGGTVDDFIIGGSGSDVISGNAGNDRLDGRNGRDTLTGGAGNDTLRGGSGPDSIDGSQDADVLVGGGPDTISGGDGTDRIFGGPNKDLLNGNGRDDTLFGGGGADDIAGGLGNDTLN